MISDNVIMRTIVDIPENQLAALDAWCEREKISRAEAVRQALNVVLPKKQAAQGAVSFGAWKPRKNSRKLVSAMREEWAR